MIASGCANGGILLSLDPDTISFKGLFLKHMTKAIFLLSLFLDEAIEMWGMAAANFVSLFNPQYGYFWRGPVWASFQVY